ncbi:sensor histidine kinase [Zhouia amylolytica]|uniref:Signal transduction histidine kinase internal region domain-containing protein n=1 Tax=Zhouia amylolytica AD3 TaxID=1286632 RepID=W2UPF5_9FLAO|nr:sensor histidine kinase [Zhouia amylolytica]ETN95873.1 hypothetical protein P278_15950 [Zhouia amylolytica AD3]
MILKLNTNKWLPLKLFIAITAAIPVFITAYELITTQKDSVIFLGNFHPLAGVFAIIYYALLMLTVFTFGIIWLIKQLKALMRLKHEKAQTELLHLKSQVNPHFFFNTLNNLYGLAGKDPAKAQNMILKLSDMMRYSIYEGQASYVPMVDEITYIKNYIALNKARYHKEIDVKLSADIDDNYPIMPLLLIILVENAFKHGVENLGSEAFVHIHLQTKQDRIHFSVLNNYDTLEATTKTGIGIKNLKRRLQLVYPDQHDLILKANNGIYKAQLIIKQ